MDTLTHGVVVSAAGVWSSAVAPRPEDELALTDEPDIAGWLRHLDATTPSLRLGLHGRLETQALLGEPVLVDATAGKWSHVHLPWQASARHPDGYPGWMRSVHIGAPEKRTSFDAPQPSDQPTTPLAAARKHLGLPYLWGGISNYGLDCSGLVHVAFRACGVLVPRDARDQHEAAVPIPLDEVEPGDLYFFARRDGTTDHVGFASQTVGPDNIRWMLHAPEKGADIVGVVEDAPMANHRVASLVAAGRLLH